MKYHLVGELQGMATLAVSENNVSYKWSMLGHENHRKIRIYFPNSTLVLGNIIIELLGKEEYFPK